MSPHRERIIITLECPADLPEREAVADLRRVLKRVLRPWGWRCVDMAVPKPPANLLEPSEETSAPPTP